MNETLREAAKRALAATPGSDAAREAMYALERAVYASEPAPASEWTAKQHREDATVVQAVLQRVAERSTGQPVFVPLDDASDVLMGLHQAGLYRASEPAPEDTCEHGRSAHTDTGCLHCSCKRTYSGDLASEPAPASGEGHDPDQPCRACGHREHDHHHSAEPRWCGAGDCPCPGFTATPPEPGLDAGDDDGTIGEGSLTPGGNRIGPKAWRLILALNAYDDFMGIVLDVVDEAAALSASPIPSEEHPE